MVSPCRWWLSDLRKTGEGIIVHVGNGDSDADVAAARLARDREWLDPIGSDGAQSSGKGGLESENMERERGRDDLICVGAAGFS